MKDLTLKEILSKTLTGMSLAIVVALLPGALLSEISKYFQLTYIYNTVSITQYLLGALMGISVGIQFKMTPIQIATLAVVTQIGTGNFRFTEVNGSMVALIGGVGDVLNAWLALILGVIFIQLIGERLKSYTILILPMSTILIVGSIVMFTHPYVSFVSAKIGELINYFTTLQPVLMGMLIAIAYSWLILSPLSTVGIALAIGLVGVGAGTANLGVIGSQMVCCIFGWSVNSQGISLSHVLGTPKIQLSNLFRVPRMFIPCAVVSAILGAIGGFLSIETSTFAAGFGLSGFLGPVGYMGIYGFTIDKLIFTTSIFFILPLILTVIAKIIFMDKLKIVQADDYKLDL